MTSSSRFIAQLMVALAVAVGLDPQPAAAMQPGLIIAPTRVSFDTRGRSSQITFTNGSTFKRSYSVETKKWSQDQTGKWILEDTDDISATPPIFTILPDKKQVLRIALGTARDPDREMTYRVLVTEIPQDDLEADIKRTLQQDGKTDAMGIGIRLQYTYSLPIFVAPQRAASDGVAEVVRDGEGMSVELSNRGNAHWLTSKAVVQQGADSVDMDANGYVLAGAKNRWRIDTQRLRPGVPAELTITSDRGVVAKTVFQP